MLGGTVAVVLRAGPRRETRPCTVLLGLLWAIVVWGLVGGAIARLALVRVSRSPGLSTFGAIRFALRHAVPLIATPLCAFLGVGSAALLFAGFGLLYWLPAGIGGVVGGILLFFPLVLGLIMALDACRPGGGLAADARLGGGRGRGPARRAEPHV